MKLALAFSGLALFTLAACSSDSRDSAANRTDPVTASSTLKIDGPVTSTDSTDSNADTADTDGSPTTTEPQILYSAAVQVLEAKYFIESYGLFVSEPSLSLEDYKQSWLTESDICEIGEDNQITAPTSTRAHNRLENATTVSAGENITITSPIGTYGDLPRKEESDITYKFNQSHTGTSLRDMVVDIPGDDFPAFSNVEIPYAELVEFTNNSFNASITPLTKLTWISDNNPYSYLRIATFSTDETTGRTIQLICKIMDDGSFEYPLEVQALMGEDFSSQHSQHTFVERTLMNFTHQDNAVVLTSHSNTWDQRTATP